VANYGSDSISIIDTAQFAVVGSIAVDSIPNGPLSISFASQSSVGYVTTVVSGRCIRINPEYFGFDGQSFVLAPQFVDPEAVAVTPDGMVAYVAATLAGSQTGVVITLNAATARQQRWVVVGSDPHGIAVTPDNRSVYIANTGSDTVSVLSRPGDQLFTTIPVGHSPMGVTTAMVPEPCVGDCDGNGAVSVDELVRNVAAALGIAPPAECPTSDVNGDGQTTIDELVAAVNNALKGCPDE
jgi:YVTN family beta-propeller protein